MIYLIVGQSCAGKSQFVVNTFMKGYDTVEYNDLLPVCENEKAFLIGHWLDERRVKGTDRISRGGIANIFPQIQKLLKKGQKDIVIEGDKIVSKKLFNNILSLGEKCKLYYIRCSTETSIKRNAANGSVGHDKLFKTTSTKADNIFWKFFQLMDGEIIDTEYITDFSDFGVCTNRGWNPKESHGYDDVAVLISTNGRARNQITYSTLRRIGYTGKIFLVVDDEDVELAEYKRIYGDSVKIFSKKEYFKKADLMINKADMCAAIFSRNACFDIAKENGISFFVNCDDDIKDIKFADIRGRKLITRKITDFDTVMKSVKKFMTCIGSDAMSICEDGVYVGGLNEKVKTGAYWSMSHWFFFSSDTDLRFRGLWHDDRVFSMDVGKIGKIAFSMSIMRDTLPSENEEEKQKGGMRSGKERFDRYSAEFMTLIAHPDVLKMYLDEKSGKWKLKRKGECASPKIISGKHKKA